MATCIAVIDDVCIVVALRRRHHRHHCHHRRPTHGYGILRHRVEWTREQSRMRWCDDAQRGPHTAGSVVRVAAG
jgi:hypothetical protein